MKIYITSMNFDLYEEESLSDGISISFCRGRNEISYIAVSNHNKITGEYYTHENIDNLTINEIKRMVEENVKKEFKEFIAP